MKAKIRELCRRRAHLFVQRSALAVVLMAEEDDSADQLITALLRAMLRWRHRRGKKTAALSVSFIVSPEIGWELAEGINRLYREDRMIGPLFERLATLSFVFWDYEGIARKQLVLTEGTGIFREFKIAPVSDLYNSDADGEPHDRKTGGIPAISHDLGDMQQAMTTLNRDWRIKFAVAAAAAVFVIVMCRKYGIVSL